MSSGNSLSLIIINKTKLGFKISFRTLISQLFVLDTICVIFSILMFSIHFHSEFYRLQVEYDDKISRHSQHSRFCRPSSRCCWP